MSHVSRIVMYCTICGLKTRMNATSNNSLYDLCFDREYLSALWPFLYLGQSGQRTEEIEREDDKWRRPEANASLFPFCSVVNLGASDFSFDFRHRRSFDWLSNNNKPAYAYLYLLLSLQSWSTSFERPGALLALCLCQLTFLRPSFSTNRLASPWHTLSAGSFFFLWKEGS